MSRNDMFGRASRWPFLVGFSLVFATACPVVARAAVPPAPLLAVAVIGQGSYGTIKGRLVWGGETVPPAKVLAAKGAAPSNPEICAKDQRILSHELEVDPATKGVAFGFAYIPKPKGTNPEAIKDLIANKPNVEIDQRNCEFLPHSLAMLQDQTLMMKSSDPTGHNVHVTGFSNGINQSIAPNGTLPVKLVAEKRPLTLQCDIHPWMKGNILVFEHPFFAVTGPDGSFTIKGVPAGRQNVVVWQEKVGYVTSGGGAGKAVDVVAGEVTDMGSIAIDPAKATR